MEIRSRLTGSVIYKDGSETMKETLINAVRSGIDLSYCNLSGSDGLKYAQISFSGFGERNRLVSLIDINRDGNPIFSVGAFQALMKN